MQLWTGPYDVNHEGKGDDKVIYLFADNTIFWNSLLEEKHEIFKDLEKDNWKSSACE